MTEIPPNIAEELSDPMPKQKIWDNGLFIFLLLGNIVLGIIIWYLVRILSVQIPQVFVQMPYQPANIVVDANNLKGKMNPFWLGFAQGGEEFGGMLESTVGKMKALRPSYIRMDHIFDDDYYAVVSGSSGNLSFDFSKLDVQVDAILAMGAKPFFSLGYMPKALADSKIDAPRNWDDWQSLVRATVEHYSGKAGKNISGVYYEVWNEPDLESFGKWTRGGDKNYLTLYENAARGAQTAKDVNSFFIGGPATTDLYRNWTMDLYNFCGSHGLRLDFLSWHSYTTDVSRYSGYIADLYSWFGTSPMPRLVISEWGPTPEKSNSYSGIFAATHAFAAVRQLLDLVNLTTVFEIKDGPGQGNSGWGLLSHDTAGLTTKPRYQAFSWLAQVQGERIYMTGEGSNVTGWGTRDGDKITVYLVNYGPGAASEAVPVEITGLSDGNWDVMREVMFGSKSSESASAVSGSIKTTLDLGSNQVGRVVLTKI